MVCTKRIKTIVEYLPRFPPFNRLVKKKHVGESFCCVDSDFAFGGSIDL